MSNLGQTFLPNIKHLRPDVVMLCANDGWDVRALKEARSLAAAGLSVVIVGRRRFHTELARFTDEFDIDIVDVPMLNEPNTMQLHLESGLWFRMNLYEKILTSFIFWWFRISKLKIKPKFVPPPVSRDVLNKLQRRKSLLSKLAQRRKRHKVAVKNLPLWRQALSRGYVMRVGGIANRLRHRPLLFLIARAVAFLGKTLIGIALLPVLLLILPFWAIYKAYRWVYRKGNRFIPDPPNILGRIHNRLKAEIVKSGRNLFRYSRFFLYTVEYGETVARLNPKIIHAHDLYTLQAATRIAKWTGAKVVYDAHELESDRRADTSKRMRKWIIKQEKKYARLADGHIAVSHAIGDEIVSECKIKVQPTVIFNSPVIKEMPIEMEGRNIRDDLRLFEETPLFVFVGKVYEIYTGNQKISFIIEAVANNPEYHLAIIGPTSKNAREQIAELLKERNCADRVHLVPPIPAEAIVHYIKSGDVGIYFMWPDTRNIDLTIPNKLFEFSLSGLPLVVSSLFSTRWFCEQYDNAIPVEENSIDAITLACQQAYLNRETLKPSPQQLFEMQRDYSWDAQGRKLWTFYRGLLTQKGES